VPHAIRIHETGGAEVLRWDEFDAGAPGPGEVRLRQTAIGANFLDIYHRAGTHHMPLDPLPAVPGVEGAGVVEAVGTGVAEVEAGDRVAYPITVGSYAEIRIIPAAQLVPLPDEVADDVAAAVILKGLTAEVLLRRTTQIAAGDEILVHAAAGGVGLILCQWAKHLGATVIGTVSTDEKAELARRYGCAHVINYSHEDFVSRVQDITSGRGVRAVFDAVGKDTFLGSLACVASSGTLASYGLASGPLPPFGFADLPMSAYLTRASVRSVTESRETLLQSAAALFDALRTGAVEPVISARYPLSQAAEAHVALETRRTTGSLILEP
jgi:NADPH2:quinone reductase